MKLSTTAGKEKTGSNLWFCGSPDHQRQTVCPLMSSLGTKKTDISTFLSHIMGDAPYSAWPDEEAGPDVIVMKSVPSGGQHIVVHRKFSILAGGMTLLNTIYECSMIDKTGLPLPNYGHVFFEGQAVIQFIGKISSVKNRHVFSTMGV
jgi:hypothetical protein